ncbi:hypothetical protein evm_013999 [Chilo suppressalis]|nr:hypothetical protein evm_013999 [Chilo suppressalis]
MCAEAKHAVGTGLQVNTEQYQNNKQVPSTYNARNGAALQPKRYPTVGDKFASRAGQKGICSQRWAAEDLPFTESGLIPDILFNPHGFPSRMTIAMMIECMAGKAASLHGHVHDASPFRFNEKDTAINYFGRLLEAGGYNYYGTERMYSGVDGREMTADIFYGVIHYQRLRHMVSDKWQVRTTGVVDALTRQPVKGRRRGGGVRLGEMERDALLSHGAAFILQDRLFHCSDKCEVSEAVYRKKAESAYRRLLALILFLWTSADRCLSAPISADTRWSE